MTGGGIFARALAMVDEKGDRRSPGYAGMRHLSATIGRPRVRATVQRTAVPTRARARALQYRRSQNMGFGPDREGGMSISADDFTDTMLDRIAKQIWICYPPALQRATDIHGLRTVARIIGGQLLVPTEGMLRCGCGWGMGLSDEEVTVGWQAMIREAFRGI